MADAYLQYNIAVVIRLDVVQPHDPLDVGGVVEGTRHLGIFVEDGDGALREGRVQHVLVAEPLSTVRSAQYSPTVLFVVLYHSNNISVIPWQ